MMAELAPPWGKFGHPSGQVRQRNCPGLLLYSQTSHPGSGCDRTIASERHSTALATLYIGGSVTCSQKKTQGA